VKVKTGLYAPISTNCVWSVITAHNITPEKRDNNIISVMHILTRSSITVSMELWIVPRSSVSLLLEFRAMLRVSF